MHRVKTPRSINAVRWRLMVWRGLKFCVVFFLGLVVVRLSIPYPWFIHLPMIVVFAFGVAYIGRFLPQVLPRRWRWVAHTRNPREGALYVLPITESFEIDLPCVKCGAPNVGVEAAEWGEGRSALAVFRTCKECGDTHWWAPGENPPRVRRREKAAGLPESCTKCGYSLTGTPVKTEGRGSDRVAFVQQCPECGRAEFFVPPASTKLPPPPQLASRLAAGSGSAGG